MDAGAYTQKISIEKLSHNYDSIGNPVEEWKPFKKTYAYMNGLSGKEYWEAATLMLKIQLILCVGGRNFLMR